MLDGIRDPKNFGKNEFVKKWRAEYLLYSLERNLEKLLKGVLL